MSNKDRQQRILQLRKDLAVLETEITRPLPKKWKVGQRVRFLRYKEWAWDKGLEATVVELDTSCKGKSADEYQVFWTEPDSGGATWWTTPYDVELVIG